MKRIFMLIITAFACPSAAQAFECGLQQPPGWTCDASGQAFGSLPGWHGETDKITGRTVMVPDNLTAREAIRRGEIVTDDLFEVVEEPGCRQRHHNDVLYCRDTWKRIKPHSEVGEDEEVPL
jgi:hypothetical protein